MFENGLNLYFILINILGFLLMGIDKWKAKRQKWRIRESSLFLVAFLGGAIGSFIGMYVFHHKTKHLKFVLGFLILSIIDCFGYVFLLNLS